MFFLLYCRVCGVNSLFWDLFYKFLVNRILLYFRKCGFNILFLKFVNSLFEALYFKSLNNIKRLVKRILLYFRKCGFNILSLTFVNSLYLALYFKFLTSIIRLDRWIQYFRIIKVLDMLIGRFWRKLRKKFA